MYGEMPTTSCFASFVCPQKPAPLPCRCLTGCFNTGDPPTEFPILSSLFFLFPNNVLEHHSYELAESIRKPLHAVSEPSSACNIFVTCQCCYDGPRNILRCSVLCTKAQNTRMTVSSDCGHSFRFLPSICFSTEATAT